MDAEEVPLSYECEKKPLKINSGTPGEVDYLCDLFKGRFNVTANVNHEGKISTVKVFDKSDVEGDDAAKREFKNLKTLRHEKMVSFSCGHSLIRGVLIQSCSAGAKSFINYMYFVIHNSVVLSKILKIVVP